MKIKTVSPYGTWNSPVTTDLIVSKTIGLDEILLDNGDVYWLEMRPEENGRYAITRLTATGNPEDVGPDDLNARSRVHEYGGGSYLVDNGQLYSCNFRDQNLYKIINNSTEQITDVNNQRFADFILDKARHRLVSIMETHHSDGRVENALVAIDLNTGNIKTLAEGYDFYSSPRLSPDNKQLCWHAWNHPNMPWDDSELWLANIDENGSLVDQKRIAGGTDESVYQPQWSSDGILFFISDRNGWWNIYQYVSEQVTSVLEKPVDFGMAQWSFRQSSYDFINTDNLICTWSDHGIGKLGIINISTGKLEEIETCYTEFRSVHADAGKAVFMAASPQAFPAIVKYEFETSQLSILKKASSVSIETENISTGVSIEYPTENGKTAFGFFYKPENALFQASDTEKPPLLVFTHGGPTGMSGNGLKIVIQYFTSRGIAVLDVNYGGSSGFGRAYRQRLNGQWGIVDIDDCVNGAMYLAQNDYVDVNRLAIRGGSAGGYTTLAALTFRNVFKAGCSRYGVSDLATLARETHKFESHYLETLIGPYPEQAELYRQRSPLFSADKLSTPVIFFQGMEDKIVLPNQAEMMVEALKKNGQAVAYIAFENEQHGFRQAESIKRSLDGELYF